MANAESDVTYCSEVEKESNSLQLRRSQRLLQKPSLSFRSNRDPASQRFEEIHQMVKSDTLCNDLSKADWLALRLEVGLIKKSARGIARSKLTFVQKKINQHSRISNATSNSNISLDEPDDLKENVPSEPAKSPNILAGMTTEVLAELPPYQPNNILNKMTTVESSVPSILVTQVNPLDLTKKVTEKPPDACVVKESVQMEGQLQTNLNKKDKIPNSMIDLTDDIVIEANQEIPAPMIEENHANSENAMYTSKWLKYLPTPQKPKTLNERPKALSPLKDKPTTFKQSLRKLYNDNLASTTNNPEKTRKSILDPNPSKIKTDSKSLKPRCKENSKQKHLWNTESAFGRDVELADIRQRNAQSEHISSLSPVFFPDELIQLDLQELNYGASVTSLPFSLKASFKKVFGTDSLDDVLGCEKVIYSLTERHVVRLASSLNIEHDSLKRTIERILVDDNGVNCVLLEDDIRSGSSVVECSQSPPHRLFRSQKSQTSK